MSKALVHIEKGDTVKVSIPKNSPETADHLTLHFGNTTVWILLEDAKKLTEDLLLAQAKLAEARAKRRTAETERLAARLPRFQASPQAARMAQAEVGFSHQDS